VGLDNPAPNANLPSDGDVPPAAVAAQLSQILKSRTFANTPLLRQFLHYVVSGALEDQADQIKEYSLGVDVFGRGVDFDPRADTIVRVHARRLRAKLAEYYETEGSADPLVIEIPKGHYAPAFRPAASADESAGRQTSFARTVKAGAPPASRTALIGREQDLHAVAQLLVRDHVRLVTLTGPGGSGKTRLGLQVASTLAGEFPGGVDFISLASIAAPSAVAWTIAESLGIRRTGGQSIVDAIEVHVRRTVAAPRLLVLDNFEHVIDAAATVVRLLEASHLLRVLVTSRAVLRVAGEHEYPVPPLPVPDSAELRSIDALRANPAVALFVERAAAVDATFTLTTENAAAVAEICARLDGLPLAIELAAARSKVFPVVAMGARLANALDFLSRGPRDLPARQQTLRSTIDWSHELLSPAERKLFRRIAVFRGGCTLEGAEAVGNTRVDLEADVADLMASLVDKSLLQYIGGDNAERRFGMLETLREYGLEQLAAHGESSTTRNAHAAYCLVLAEEGNAKMTVAERDAWLDRCALEHDNFSAGLDYLIAAGRADWGLRLVLALYMYWDDREHLLEGRERTEAVLNLPGAAARTWQRAKAATYAAGFSCTMDDHEANSRNNREALDIFREIGDRRGVTGALNALAVGALMHNDLIAARGFSEECLAACRQHDDRTATAAALSNLADVVCAQGDFDLAESLLKEARGMFALLGDGTGVAWSCNHLGDVARDRGDFDAARPQYEEGAALFHELGDPWGIARSCVDLGVLASLRGDQAAASGLFEQGLDIFLGLGHRRGIAYVFEGLAGAAARGGDHARALTLAGAAAVLRESIGARPRPREQARIEDALGPAWRELHATTSKACWAAGWRMPFDEAVQCARAWRTAPTTSPLT